jgi:hypothetical protein
MENSNERSLSVVAAKTVSVIFHPLFVPLYGLLAVFVAPTLFWYIPVRAKFFLFIIFATDNLLIPVLLMPFFRYRNIISSWSLSEQEERTVPLMTSALMFAVTSFILYRLQIPLFFKAYAYSLTIVTLFLLVVNRRWKISVYSGSAGLLVGLIISLSVRMKEPLPLFLAGSVVAAGLILSSRLKLNRHDTREVYAGFLAGLIITASIMILLQ